MRDLLAENILMMVIKRTSKTTGTLHTYNSSPNLSTPICEDDSFRYVANRMLFKCFKGNPVNLVPMTTAEFVLKLEVGDLAYYAIDLNNGMVHEFFGLEQLLPYLGISRDDVGKVVDQFGDPLQKPAPNVSPVSYNSGKIH